MAPQPWCAWVEWTPWPLKLVTGARCEFLSFGLFGCFCMFFVAPKDGFTKIYHGSTMICHGWPWFTTYPTQTILAVHQQTKVRKKLWSWNRLLQDKSRCWRCFCNDLTWRWLCGQNWELKFRTGMVNLNWPFPFSPEIQIWTQVYHSCFLFKAFQTLRSHGIPLLI